MAAPLLERLDRRDRAIFLRLAAAPRGGRAPRWWTAATHLGGTRATVTAIVAPLLLGLGTHRDALWHAALRCAAVTVVAQLLAHAVKRTVVRPRPRHAAEVAARATPLLDDPDRFSFPSGHSCAAMSVAAAYAAAAPPLAAPLVALAALVGVSRVRLGVHYPGDVLAGQAIAIATALAICGAWPGGW